MLLAITHAAETFFELLSRQLQHHIQYAPQLEIASRQREQLSMQQVSWIITQIFKAGAGYGKHGAATHTAGPKAQSHLRMKCKESAPLPTSDVVKKQDGDLGTLGPRDLNRVGRNYNPLPQSMDRFRPMGPSCLRSLCVRRRSQLGSG